MKTEGENEWKQSGTYPDCFIFYNILVVSLQKINICPLQCK
ncbi:hypothetical protein bcere0022_5630 [Bacillus cereus Rock3-44]|nr:hypothetical protein bcere0022_5630 [Bacillus cereus Rock3-44]